MRFRLKRPKWLRRPTWFKRPSWMRPVSHLTGPPNPFEAFLFMACVFQGANTLLGGVRPNSIANALSGQLPIAWAALIAVGGVLTLAGLYWRGDVFVGAELKRVGFTAAGGGTLVYGLALLTIGPTGTTAAIPNLAFTCACAVRWWQVGRAIAHEKDKTKRVLAALSDPVAAP